MTSISSSALENGDSESNTQGEICFKLNKKVMRCGPPVPSHRKRQMHVHPIDTEIHAKPKVEEHVKMFEKMYSLLSMFLKPIGIEMTYHWIPHKHIFFFFSICVVAFTWSNIFYTQAIHIKNGDTLRILEAFAIYGIATSCTQKIVGFLKNRNQIVSLIFCIRKICKQTLAGSRANILSSQFVRTFKFLKIFALGVASSVVLFLACPIKAYVVDRELMSLLPIEIVFVDQSTHSGFATGNFLMIVMGTYAALGTLLYGGIFVFYMFMYSLKVELIGQDLKDLDEMWAGKIIVPLACKHVYLKNICRKRQDINNYIYAIRRIFEKKLFFYFCFNYFSQIICLFEIAKNQWTPGYAIAMGLFIEMAFYCVMGTQITVADERLYYTIYTTNWYAYDLYSQRTILLLLQECRQPNELKLGGVGTLNVVTGIEVVKSIYTYYTILTELL